MNRFSTLLLSALGVLSSFAQESPVFFSDFNSQDDFNRWTVINANNDDYTWAWYSTGGQQVASIRWNNEIAMDDWLISPAITPAKDGMYMVTIDYQGGGSSTERLSIYTGDAPTVDALTTLVYQDNAIKTTTYGKHSFFIKGTANKPLYLGLHGNSLAGQYRININEISINESEGKDVEVAEIINPVNGENMKSETVTIKIKNNGIDAIKDFNVGFSFNDNAPVTETITSAIAPGESLVHSFATKADISVSHKMYKFKAWANIEGDEIASNDTCFVNVYNAGKATVPYFMGFEPDEDTAAIKLYNLNEDTGNWSIEVASGFWNMANTGNGVLSYDYDKVNAGNDWAILDPIEVEPGYYSLKFWYSGSNSHNERLGVYYGNGNTPDDMKNLIVEYSPFNENNYVESASVIHIKEKQDIYLGFKAFSDKDENVILVDDISFNKIEATDMDVQVLAISNPEEFIRNLSVKNINYAIKNNGIADANNTQLKVTLDGNAIVDETINIKAQSTVTNSITGGAENLSIGKHSVKVELINALDTDSTNNVIEKEFTVLGEPAKYWDFEDYTLVNGEKVFSRPSEFTYLKKDDGTLNSQVADYFPDELGWGPIEIGTHSIYGNCMLGVTSYLDNTKQADRWCILPKMHIDNKDSYFVWAANSTDPNYPETYEVKITEKPIEDDDFSTLLKVTNETSYTVSTHGVSLDEYVGKDVQVAFRLVSRNANILTLDNIGFYGQVSSGVENSLINDFKVVSDSETLKVIGNEVYGISISNMNGSILATSTTNEVSISNLQAGVYVAVINTGAKTITYKFVK